MFLPLKKYSLGEIERISGQSPTVSHMTYATVYSVLCDNVQYDFILFAYADGDGFVLVAVDIEVPALGRGGKSFWLCLAYFCRIAAQHAPESRRGTFERAALHAEQMGREA